MEAPALLLALVSAVAGPGASVWVARLAAGKTLADIEKRVTALESSEPADVARLRNELEALTKDVASLRGDVDRLTAAHDRLVAADELRRERAAERAELREQRERERGETLAAKFERVQTLLEALREEIRNARPR